jgi:outer membrane biosynthesis protein TonB
MLDPEGNVRDVRKVSSIGQKAVDDACVNVLKGQNFGVPPPEIFAQGNIFGINFIFPPVVNY